MILEEKDLWKDYFLTNNTANIIKFDDSIEEMDIKEFLKKCLKYKEIFEKEYARYYRNETYIHNQENIVEKILYGSAIIGIIQILFLNLTGLLLMGLGGNLSLLELRALRKELKEIQDYNDLLDQDIRTKKMNSIIEETKEQIKQMGSLKI